MKEKNITLELKSDVAIDFTNIVENPSVIPDEIMQQIKSVNSFYMTFSDMKSSLNKTKNIQYQEIIIKLRVKYKEKIYIYPLISYVDNKLSLVRGYFLGFQKSMDFELLKTNMSISMNSKEGFFISFQFNEKYTIKNTKKVFYPFILFPQDIKSGVVNISTLDIKEYQCKKINECHMDEKINVGSYSGSTLYLTYFRIESDGFMLYGNKKIQ